MIFKSEEELLINLIQRAIDEGLPLPEELITQVENGEPINNQFVLNFSIQAYQDKIVMDNTEEIYNNLDINTAVGDALDKKGAWLHVSRNTGSPSVMELLLTLTVGEDVTIPEGTVIHIKDIAGNGTTYYTSVECTVQQNVETTLKCDNRVHEFVSRIPVNCVESIEGFPTVNVVSSTRSTTGGTIEDDDAYRERILKWNSINFIGTESCISDYLDKYPGVDDYKLVPLWDGTEYNVIGALTIVADTLEELLPDVQEDVYKNCMLFCDPKPRVILPNVNYIDDEDTFTLDVILKNNLTLTEDELKQIIITQSHTYFNGGITRSGKSIKGLHIGDNLAPSQFEKFLLEEVPEILDVNCNQNTVIYCPEDTRLDVVDVEVNFV